MFLNGFGQLSHVVPVFQANQDNISTAFPDGCVAGSMALVLWISYTGSYTSHDWASESSGKAQISNLDQVGLDYV